jgi:WD40 repeat protein
MDSVTFHPSGDFLATGGRDGTIAVWDLIEGTLLHKLKGHTGSVIVSRGIGRPSSDLSSSVQSTQSGCDAAISWLSRITSL